MAWLRKLPFACLPLVVLLTPSPLLAQGDAVGFVQLTVQGKPPVPFLQTWFDDGEEPFLHFNEFADAAELLVRFEQGIVKASGVLPDGRTIFELNLRNLTVLVGGTS